MRVDRCVGVRAWPTASRAVAMASVCEARSFPSFPRSGGVFVAEEAVKVLRPVVLSASASLAGRGGEGRGRYSWELRFCWCRWWWSPSFSLLWPALAARGAVDGGGWAFVVAGLGVAASAGSSVVLGRRRVQRG